VFCSGEFVYSVYVEVFLNLSVNVVKREAGYEFSVAEEMSVRQTDSTKYIEI